MGDMVWIAGLVCGALCVVVWDLRAGHRWKPRGPELRRRMRSKR